MEAISISFEMLVFLILVAFAFDFMNGFHDAANSIATIVSTRVLRPHWAVMWAAFFNFIAFLVFGLAVANTIGTGIIDPIIVDHHIIFGALVGAIVWNLITWWYGIPSSSSHALVGGLAGAAVAKGGVKALVASGFLKTAFAIVLAPAIGFVLSGLMAFRAYNTASRGPLVSPIAIRLGVALQSGARRQRRAENDGHYRDAAVRRWYVGTNFQRAVLGGDYLSGGHRAWHALRRLANRQDHGTEDHQAQTRRWILRRNRQRHYPVL